MLILTPPHLSTVGIIIYECDEPTTKYTRMKKKKDRNASTIIKNQFIRSDRRETPTPLFNDLYRLERSLRR